MRASPATPKRRGLCSPILGAVNYDVERKRLDTIFLRRNALLVGLGFLLHFAIAFLEDRGVALSHSIRLCVAFLWLGVMLGSFLWYTIQIIGLKRRCGFT